MLPAAIDRAAHPPGGWRRKSKHGAFTVSLAAHFGMAFGAEWRSGQYGVVRERLGNTYPVAPTLIMPFGLDLAWGKLDKTLVGVFIPAIDPAAFLQYDIQNNGRLPGPRPITALSPGVGGRVGLGRSPFSLMGMFVYRPKLRTWEPTVSGPGADAIQLLLGLTIDVTLWEIHHG